MKTIITTLLVLCLTSTADAQLFRTGLLARISQASGCSQSMRVTNNTSCGGQSRVAAASCSSSRAMFTPVRSVIRAAPVRTVIQAAPVRRVLRSVVPPIVVPRVMNCPSGNCPVSVAAPRAINVVQSQPGYHSHLTNDGRIVTHSDSNFGNAAAHVGIAYPWLKIPSQNLVSIF